MLMTGAIPAAKQPAAAGGSKSPAPHPKKSAHATPVPHPKPSASSGEGNDAAGGASAFHPAPKPSAPPPSHQQQQQQQHPAPKPSAPAPVKAAPMPLGAGGGAKAIPGPKPSPAAGGPGHFAPTPKPSIAAAATPPPPIPSYTADSRAAALVLLRLSQAQEMHVIFRKWHCWCRKRRSLKRVSLHLAKSERNLRRRRSFHQWMVYTLLRASRKNLPPALSGTARLLSKAAAPRPPRQQHENAEDTSHPYPGVEPYEQYSRVLTAAASSSSPPHVPYSYPPAHTSPTPSSAGRAMPTSPVPPRQYGTPHRPSAEAVEIAMLREDFERAREHTARLERRLEMQQQQQHQHQQGEARWHVSPPALQPPHHPRLQEGCFESSGYLSPLTSSPGSRVHPSRPYMPHESRGQAGAGYTGAVLSSRHPLDGPTEIVVDVSEDGRWQRYNNTPPPPPPPPPPQQQQHHYSYYYR